jgi:hypothetical protein
MHLRIGPWGKYYLCPSEACKNKGHSSIWKVFCTGRDHKRKNILKKKGVSDFWAHPGYPEVKKTLPVLLKEICPDCGSHLVERRGKTGRPFIGCSAYPNCKYIKSRFFKKGGAGKSEGKKSIEELKNSKAPKNKKTKTVVKKKAAKKSARKTKTTRVK